MSSFARIYTWWKIVHICERPKYTNVDLLIFIHSTNQDFIMTNAIDQKTTTSTTIEGQLRQLALAKSLGLLSNDQASAAALQLIGFAAKASQPKASQPQEARRPSGVPEGYISRSRLQDFVKESIYTINERLKNGGYILDRYGEYTLTEKGRSVGIAVGHCIYFHLYDVAKALNLNLKY